MRIENYAKEKLTGKFDVILEPNENHSEPIEFSVKLTEQDEIDTVVALDDYEKDKEKSLKKQKEIVRRVLERSYPDMSKDDIDKIVVALSNELLLEFCFIWGIRSREAVKKLIELQKKKLAELDKLPENEQK